jgi:hypothetical protein
MPSIVDSIAAGESEIQSAAAELRHGNATVEPVQADLPDPPCRRDTNLTGTLYLLHKVGSDMRSRGSGRILITGRLPVHAGNVPGGLQRQQGVSVSFALRAA